MFWFQNDLSLVNNKNTYNNIKDKNINRTYDWVTSFWRGQSNHGGVEGTMRKIMRWGPCKSQKGMGKECWDS